MVLLIDVNRELDIGLILCQDTPRKLSVGVLSRRTDLLMVESILIVLSEHDQMLILSFLVLFELKTFARLSFLLFSNRAY